MSEEKGEVIVKEKGRVCTWKSTCVGSYKVVCGKIVNLK